MGERGRYEGEKGGGEGERGRGSGGGEEGGEEEGGGREGRRARARCPAIPQLFEPSQLRHKNELRSCLECYSKDMTHRTVLIKPYPHFRIRSKYILF